jgi:Tetraacyldisaccharide-1-P 4''-kinase
VFRNLKVSQIIIGAEVLCGNRVFAVVGIGNSQRFFQQLSDMGLNIEAYAFFDHYVFRSADLAFVGNDVLLMTEKDAVKCSVFVGLEWWYLSVDAVVDYALIDYLRNLKIAEHPYLQAHAVSSAIAHFTIIYDRIDLAQPENKLAQRPDKQQATIAETLLYINNYQLDITLQTIILQTIIADDQIALRINLHQHLHRCHAVYAYPYGTTDTTHQQQELITDKLRRTIHLNYDKLTITTTITTTDNSGRKTNQL